LSPISSLHGKIDIFCHGSVHWGIGSTTNQKGRHSTTQNDLIAVHRGGFCNPLKKVDPLV
jgi:hypothetical protein